MLYYQYNSHGDVVSVLNRTGAVKNEYDYDAFGNAITEKETVSNPYRYAGYYQDAETGLYYLKSRYYNPRTARFLTEDTASGTYTDPLSLNRYTYCHNQPVTGYDPDGHFLHIVAGAVIGAVVNSAVSAYTQYKNTGKVDPRTTLGAAAEGAIVGGTAAATCGTSLGVTVVAGATASAAGNAANQYISTGAVDVSQMMLSAVGGAAAFGTANLAGSLLKAGSSAAAQASAKATGSAGMQAAAKAGGSALGKMVSASAAGGITGMAAGVSADLAVQTTEILSGMSDGYDLERTKNSALLGGAVGAGLGAASQTPLVQKAGAKFHAWDAVLKEKTGNIGEGFQASMADNRGFADFDALSGKKTSGGVYGESGSNSVYIPMDADGNPIPLNKQRINGQDIPLPDPEAQGRPHTVLGGKVSSGTGEVYRQSATFSGGSWPTANGYEVPLSEVHWTNHGRADAHTNPHQHVFNYDFENRYWYRSDPEIF